VALTVRLVAESGLTALMVTHNMGLALAVGTRTLMMHDGEIILDLSAADRAGLTVRGLVDKFFALRGAEVASDRMLLY
jgi:putative ABC transport system ATP-binding protein